MNLTNEVIVAVVFEVNLVHNITEWVGDTKVTKHFLDYENVNKGEQVFLGDAHATPIVGKVASTETYIK